jgi:hypothetical protein
MMFSEIKELTYKKDGTCIINGEVLQLDGIQLRDGVDVIQYHSAFDYYIEEPAMIQVSLEKYSNILTKWNEYPREPETKPTYDSTTHKLVEDGTEAIGGLTYKKYSVAELTQEDLDAKFKASVPQQVTMRQARLALLQNGLLATVTSAIESGTDEEMKIEWEYAMDVRRDWESLNTMATSLDITEKQLDELFMLAGSL